VQPTNLYRSCANLSGALTASGLLEAIRSYRSGLLSNSGKLAAQGQLAQACADYIAAAQAYDSDTRRVVERLHLTELQSEQFWSSITDGAALRDRQRLLVAAYSKVLFASNHLPSLMDTLRLLGDDAVASDAGTLQLLLLDADLPASSPDRLARVIDGIDLIYQACAAIISRSDQQPLQLQSIHGQVSRTLTLRGEQSLLSAACHVLTVAQDTAQSSQRQQQDLREQLALMQPVAVLDRLDVLGRHSDAEIEQIRESLIAGSIMLIEATVQIDSSDTGRAVAHPISSDTFSQMDDLVSHELAQHSRALVDRERARMLEQADLRGTASGSSSTNADHPESASGNLIDERIDELIVDLNRFYNSAGRR
jgi:hypothetical protein